MKKFFSALILLATAVAYGAASTAPTKFQTDTLDFGHYGSTANHNLVFDFGLATNPTLYVDNATDSLWYNYGNFNLGTGAAANQSLTFNIGGSNPQIRWNNSSGVFQYTLNGSTYHQINNGTDITSGSATVGQVLQADGAGNSLWGAAAGGGSKNYLNSGTTSNGTNTQNGNFEASATVATNWSLGHVSLTSNFPSGTPTFGSGASSNLAMTATSTGALEGNYSGLLTNTGSVSVAGDFLATNAFYIDTEDQAKMLTVKYYYSLTTGSSGTNFSGTSSNTFGVAIYDVTNSAWIQPAGVWNFTQNSGPNYGTATFQTTKNSTQYRLVFFTANAASSAYTMLLDSVSVGPQTAPTGPAVLDIATYSPTITGDSAPTSTKFTWYRIGDKAYISGFFVVGTPTSSYLSIPLPSGLSIDYTKLTSGNPQYLGSATLAQNSNYTYASGAGLAIFVDGSTTGSLFVSYHNDSDTISKVPGSTILVASEQLSFTNIAVPIVGWSSNTAMSSDTDTRVVAFNASGTSTVTGGGTVGTIVPTTINSDTHGGYQGSGIYKIPVTGYYDVSANFTGNATSWTSGQRVILYVQYGSNSVEMARDTIQATASQITSVSGTIKSLYLTSGTSVNIAILGDQGLSNAVFNWSLGRQSGPSVIAATESVLARYTGQVAFTAGGGTIAPATKVFDSHNAYNAGTGIYTVPVSGKYRVTAAFSYIAFTDTAGSNMEMDVYHNSSSDTIIAERTGTSSTTNVHYTAAGSAIVQCLAGDTLSIYGLFSIGGTGVNTVASNNANYVSFERVGN